MSKIQLSPFMTFHGRAREALQFYQEVLGGKVDRVTKVFNGLAEGGKIKGPLTEQSGGARVGYVLDKFGINCVVSIDRA
jgi:uncharacterized glyoxalase superfamily protein PhnB